MYNIYIYIIIIKKKYIHMFVECICVRIPSSNVTVEFDVDNSMELMGKPWH